MIRLFRVNGITRHHTEQAFVHLTLPCKRTRWHFKTGSSRGEPGMFLVFLTVQFCLMSQIHTVFDAKFIDAMHVAVWQARSRASPSSGSSNSSNCHEIASEMEAWSEAAVAMRILRHRLWPEKFLLRLGNFVEKCRSFLKTFRIQECAERQRGLEPQQIQKGSPWGWAETDMRQKVGLDELLAMGSDC